MAAGSELYRATAHARARDVPEIAAWYAGHTVGDGERVDGGAREGQGSVADMIETNVKTVDDCRKVFEQLDIRGWKQYTPTWTAASGGTSIGNGSALGFYATTGGLCLVEIDITFGTTTTFGSGIYVFSMPFPPNTRANIQGSARLTHSGVVYAGICTLDEGTTNLHIVSASAPSYIAHNVPWTWAIGGGIEAVQATILYPYR
jgi:hypothetical protein